VTAVRDLANTGVRSRCAWVSLLGAAVIVASSPLTVRAYMRKA
jgi:hypothetical protein